MASRYGPTPIGINSSNKYSELFQDRNVKFIQQYTTTEMNALSSGEVGTLNLISHTWIMGDRYYKLAYEYYNDSKLWWVIARFNQKPTEAHLKVGDTVLIPLPLEQVLQFWEL